MSSDPRAGGPWRSTFDLYRVDDPESARIRALHLDSVQRLTPYVMAANVVNGTVLGAAFFASAPLTVALWLSMLAAVVILALRGWALRRHLRPQRASRRALHRSTWHAAVLGSVWAMPPLLWFAGASPPQQLLLTALVSGMMAAGAFVLGPLPVASLVYVAVLTVASLASLALAAEPLYLLVAFLLLCYALVLAVSTMAASRQATALLRSEREAERQGQMVALLLRDFEEHAAEALWETGRDGCLNHVSPRLLQLLGSDGATLRQVPLVTLLRRRSTPAADALRRAFDACRPFHELRLAVDSGEGERWWSLSGKPLFDDEARLLGWRGVIADVSTEVQAQQRLQQLAHFDSLTGLANRLTLREQLHERLVRGEPAALLSIDLDHFKTINDSLGHSTGDAVLRTVAARLAGCVRAGDLVARLGGDEFAVLAPAIQSPDEPLALAQRIVDVLSEPCDCAGRQLRVGASVGVALLPEHGSSVDELLGRADLALYDAKEGGRGRVGTYSALLGERSRRRSLLEQGLRQAVREGQLSLHWQPKIALREWQISGVEALLRWQHPELGPVGPAEFVAVAEQVGLIEEVGDWVLREACHAAARHFDGLTVSVNVSPTQLRDDHFAARVQQLLIESRIEPERLELEITESIFIDDVEGALERLHALRRMGVRIALDDFGTGYSSLAYLRRFPFDTLKIDRAFVRELLLREDAKAIVRMMVQLADAMGMRTVAEGVESSEELQAVREAGCHDVQGFVVSPPCPAEAFAGLRRNWSESARPGTRSTLH